MRIIDGRQRERAAGRRDRVGRPSESTRVDVPLSLSPPPSLLPLPPPMLLMSCVCSRRERDIRVDRARDNLVSRFRGAITRKFSRVYSIPSSSTVRLAARLTRCAGSPRVTRVPFPNFCEKSRGRENDLCVPRQRNVSWRGSFSRFRSISPPPPLLRSCSSSSSASYTSLVLFILRFFRLKSSPFDSLRGARSQTLSHSLHPSHPLSLSLCLLLSAQHRPEIVRVWPRIVILLDGL